MQNIYQEAQNYWKLLPADRVAMIVDGENYYRALHEAMRQAERRIMLVGWDLHSELSLIRDGDSGGYPAKLGELLDTLVRQKDDLDVYLLSWDFAMIYAMEREFFPRYKLQWRSHRKIHFCLDGEHPIGASQHQKMVVIDDVLAFVGGFDVSKWRWDTSEHLIHDDRRRSPDGDIYPPFHDIQMAIDGEAAKAIAAMCCERWEIACGNRLSTLHASSGDVWPDFVRPDFTDVSVAISRTLPEYKMFEEVREVEALYLDSIAAASTSIYIENQYLSSYKIGKALAQRLTEPDGPEIIIVMPLKTGGWLEQHTMDVLRGNVLRQMLKADRYDHLRVFYPRLGKDPVASLMVHAKVMVIDDNFLRIGSSNLSNRSLGFDSECDLSIYVAENLPEQRSIISGFRNRLLAEHLGVPEEEVARCISGCKSLIQAVDALRSDGERTLVPIDPEITKDIDPWLPDEKVIDPEKTLEPDELINYLIDKPYQVRAYRHIVKIIGLLILVLGAAALWRWTSLGQLLSVETTLKAAQWIQEQPLSPMLVITGFVLGGVVSFPVTLLIIATIVIFGPWLGLLYTVVGTELSGLCMFFFGRLLGRETVRKLSGPLLNRLNRKLSKSGLPAVISFRIIPVAPFSVVNLIAGVSDISVRDFALGTFIGMLPGTIAIALVGDQIARSMRTPDMTGIVILGVMIVAVAAALGALRRYLKSRQNKKRN